MNGACNVKLFLALGRGQKVKYHLISITKSNAKILYQTLCVFSQMKDTKHIRRDFRFVTWVMPQGWDFGATQGIGTQDCTLPSINFPEEPYYRKSTKGLEDGQRKA